MNWIMVNDTQSIAVQDQREPEVTAIKISVVVVKRDNAKSSVDQGWERDP